MANRERTIENKIKFYENKIVASETLIAEEQQKLEGYKLELKKWQVHKKNLEKLLCAVLTENIFKSRCTAGMAPTYRNRFSFCFFNRTVYHLMRYRAGKQDQKIRRTYFLLHGTFFLGKNFCLTSEPFTDIFILTYHSFISTNNYNTHILTSYLLFLSNFDF